MKIDYRLGVAAPAQIVWEVIADLSSWSQWNPVHPGAKGEIGFGKSLSLVTTLPGLPQETVVAVVEDWTPEELLHLKVKRSRFLRSLRFLEIDKLSQTGCIFSNGELFQGFAARFISYKVKRAHYLGFKAMGEAVRDRAEALWRERGGAPISGA